MKRITIAIDGHSSCGKSTMAKDLAHEVGYIYVDTGAMYRTVTLFAIINNMFDDGGNIIVKKLCENLDNIKFEFRLNTEGRPEAWLNGENVEQRIRTMDVSSKVSQVSAIPEVRAKLVALQQDMGKNKGVVMDGRDIGTTVFPDAELKIFVTASTEVRAQRRYDELKAKGMPADYDEIKRNVEERDYIDSHREVSPLRKADDAIELDNSNISIAEQKQWLLEKFKEKVAQ